MKKLMIPFLFIVINLNAQSDSSFKRHSVTYFGTLGAGGFNTKDYRYFTFQSAFHYTYFVNKRIGFGGEINFQNTSSKYISLSDINAIGFIRINLIRNFYTELGILANKNLYNTFGTNPKVNFNFYAAVGYELKIKKNWFINFQVRTTPTNTHNRGVGITPMIGIGLKF